MNKPALRIAVVSNTAWYLFNFRLNLMGALLAAGHKVVAVAASDTYADRIRAAGIPFHAVPISGGGINPVRELRSIASLRSVLGGQMPDLVLSYTPKGNLYSALSCISLGIPFVPNVSGLGRAFVSGSPIKWVAQALYHLTFRRAHRVFFQNHEDMDAFVRAGFVHAEKAERVPGSGVELRRFAAAPPTPHAADAPVFLLVARMLWAKGIGEYVAAARLIKKAFPSASFCLLGSIGGDRASAIPREQVEEWVKEGVVTYLGVTDDVRPHIAEADCAVLPSYYREGVPRVMLEAAAMGRPVITTDAPGCRDTVVNERTGFLCRPSDVQDLAAKMAAFMALPLQARADMGTLGRAHIEQHFDEQIVLNRYIHLMTEFAANGAHTSELVAGPVLRGSGVPGA